MGKGFNNSHSNRIQPDANDGEGREGLAGESGDADQGMPRQPAISAGKLEFSPDCALARGLTVPEEIAFPATFKEGDGSGRKRGRP